MSSEYGIHDLLWVIHSSFPNSYGLMGSFFRQQSVFASIPHQKSFIWQLSSKIPASVLLEQESNDLLKLTQLAQVGWSNIGPVTARPAEPAPTALHFLFFCSHFPFLLLEWPQKGCNR